MMTHPSYIKHSWILIMPLWIKLQRDKYRLPSKLKCNSRNICVDMEERGKGGVVFG